MKGLQVNAMNLSRKTKTFFTLAFFLLGLLAVVLAVNWVIHHAILIVVLAGLGLMGYYFVSRKALPSLGRRTLL